MKISTTEYSVSLLSSTIALWFMLRPWKHTAKLTRNISYTYSKSHLWALKCSCRPTIYFNRGGSWWSLLMGAVFKTGIVFIFIFSTLIHSTTFKGLKRQTCLLHKMASLLLTKGTLLTPSASFCPPTLLILHTFCTPLSLFVVPACWSSKLIDTPVEQELGKTRQQVKTALCYDEKFWKGALCPQPCEAKQCFQANVIQPSSLEPSETQSHQSKRQHPFHYFVSSPFQL